MKLGIAALISIGILAALSGPAHADDPTDDVTTEDQISASDEDTQTATAPAYSESDTVWIDDPSTRLTSEFKATLIDLLQAHERLTGQTVRVMIDSPREDVAGPREIVISIQTDARTGAVHSHFTLDPVLPPEKTRDLAKDVLVPSLRKENLELAIQRTLKALMEAVESPVTAADLKSGEAASALQLLPDAPARGWTQNLAWITFLVLAAAAFGLFVLQILTRFEVHISSEGAAPIQPYRQWWDEVRRAVGQGRKFEGDAGGLSHGHW